MANNKSKQLAVIHNNLEALIKNKADALPKNFNATRFIQNCMVVLQDTKDIEKMEPRSVARTLLKGAFLGLDFFNKECYAIPYGNNLQFQTDYKGERKLMKKYSIRPVKDVYAKVVRAGDVYEELIIDGRPSINFKPKPFNNDEIVGFFAVCIFEDGGLVYETMSKEEVDKVRDTYSKQPTGKAWKNSYSEMGKKTVLRRLAKSIDLDFESIEAKEAWDSGSGFSFKNGNEIEPIKMPEPIEDVEYAPEPDPDENNKKETNDPEDKKEELIRKIGEAIIEKVNGNNEEARSELMRLTTFIGIDGKEVKGTNNLEDLKKWSMKRLQATWGTVKKEYGLK